MTDSAEPLPAEANSVSVPIPLAMPVPQPDATSPPPPQMTASADGLQALEGLIERLREQAEALEKTRQSLTESLARQADGLDETRASLFRAAQSLDHDLKEAAKGAKGQAVVAVLRHVIRVIDKIQSRRLATLHDVREELEEILLRHGLVNETPQLGEKFSSDRHRVVETMPTPERDKHHLIHEVRGTTWSFGDMGLLSTASVVVLRYTEPAIPAEQ